MHPRNICAPQASNVILPECMGALQAGMNAAHGLPAWQQRVPRWCASARGSPLVAHQRGGPAGCHAHWLRPSQVARPQDYNKRRKSPRQSTLACVLACTLVVPGWSRVLRQTRAGGPWSGWSTGWRASWACTHAGGCRARRSASTHSAAPAPPASPPRSGPTAARWSRTSTASARPTRQARSPCRPHCWEREPCTERQAGHAPHWGPPRPLRQACTPSSLRQWVSQPSTARSSSSSARRTHLQCIYPPCAAGPTTVR